MSNDYISRADAKRLIADIQLGETPKDAPRTVYLSGVHEGLNMAYGAIASMRPADVRPVVYCKDCIYWKTFPSPAGDKKYCCVFAWINSSTGMDYCSFAEKRQEDMREATEGQSKEGT